MKSQLRTSNYCCIYSKREEQALPFLSYFQNSTSLREYIVPVAIRSSRIPNRFCFAECDPYGNRLHFCLWQKLLFRSVKPSRARLHRSLAFSLFDSRTDKKIQAHRCVPVFFGDPYGNRTHVTAVKGRCLNRLTNGPGSGDLT